jgi:hypothetical protein
MGTLLFWGVIVAGGFLGIILISLLSMAQKAEEVYERLPGVDTMTTRSGPHYLSATENPLPANRDEVRLQGKMRESVAAP